MNSVLTLDKLEEHAGHDVVITAYGQPDLPPVNFTLECMECYEVLADADNEEATE